MAIGSGRFDELATYVREKADAASVVVIVLPKQGKPGFSVQSVDLEVARWLPTLLRSMADEIDKEARS